MTLLHLCNCLEKAWDRDLRAANRPEYCEGLKFAQDVL